VDPTVWETQGLLLGHGNYIKAREENADYGHGVCVCVCVYIPV
jgi:hypothetical protein